MAQPLRSWLGGLVRHTFPTTRMAFAYGSGVFSQVAARDVKEDAKRPMIDMVFAVDDPVAWHTENIERNRSHYSFIASPVCGGASRVAAFQDTAARVWYNAMVPLPEPWGSGGGQMMKYGVISHSALVDDLQNWSSFYISGRMQKPVAMIDGFGIHGRTIRASGITTEMEDDKLFNASQQNLQCALAAALLTLPEKFSEQTLYETIAGLSYAGDFRMSIAENPEKVKNIVRNGGSPARFQHLYRRAMENISHKVHGLDGTHGKDTAENRTNSLSSELCQDMSVDARIELVMSLPLRLRKRMAGYGLKDFIEEERVDEALKTKLYSRDTDHEVHRLGAELVSSALQEIVSQTALQQTMKGLASAGFKKSLLYSYNKIGKRLGV